jgi:glutathione synthase
MGARKALFVLDPPETFSPTADSTYVMVTEALRRGHEPYGALLRDLSLHASHAFANARPLGFREGDDTLRFIDAPARRPMSDFDVVVMRKDPPVDQGFMTSTWILDRAGTLVINHPAGLRSLNEKLSIAAFAEFTPRTFVSRDADELREILAKLGGRMIVKPVYGFGGREILLAREDDPNLGSLLEIATAEGTRWTVAQEYVPAASEGDKRILLVDGAPIGAVLRVPAQGEIRNNFHAGGSPVRVELDANDKAICEAVGPMLRETGQFFVGLDVIGGKLTEINVTSPTGMQEINRLEQRGEDETTQALFWDALESKLGAAQSS